MKYIFTLLSILLLSTQVGAHEVPIANFDLTLEGTTLNINITFDHADLKKACKLKGKHKRYTEEQRNEIITNYLHKHLQLSINTKERVLKIETICEENHHIVIQGKYEGVEVPIQSINIENTCLLKEVLRHSNVITTHLNGKTRGFRMDSKRRKINIDY